ncbi:cob(I)yrinic acid a,c-diamide adenosyltransferase [Thiomicrospira sp. WB1]|uniref:cob(I)yrinic acid a,c-diamide adenosyltransferase n=1 Tax=Thiomicrospira sp. WB1 TaxID=1685380 RepID=UPI000749AABB|nr:cob(I)yrinic acid a,c-diamide adenosyltransferase [Thiomicrospira sp. WB1]KUJ72850.1 cob(I)yrinic acid a,c-diamide adenosyltransferase [Thiomicrospira sp. WB1]
MTESDATQNDRHRVRMQRKKAQVDAAIARADQKKGLLLVLTGHGKGKSTSAFGSVARALGHGLNVGVCQFIKARTDTGEEAFFSQHPHCEWHVLGDGFTWDTQDRQADIDTSKRGWAVAERMLSDPGYDLVVLDELTYLLSLNYLDADRVLDALSQRPRDQHAIVTGRSAIAPLRALADTVSEIKEVKHAFHAGIQAQMGLDY